MPLEMLFEVDFEISFILALLTLDHPTCMLLHMRPEVAGVMSGVVAVFTLKTVDFTVFLLVQSELLQIIGLKLTVLALQQVGRVLLTVQCEVPGQVAFVVAVWTEEKIASMFPEVNLEVAGVAGCVVADLTLQQLLLAVLAHVQLEVSLVARLILAVHTRAREDVACVLPEVILEVAGLVGRVVTVLAGEKLPSVFFEVGAEVNRKLCFVVAVTAIVISTWPLHLFHVQTVSRLILLFTLRVSIELDDMLERKSEQNV